MRDALAHNIVTLVVALIIVGSALAKSQALEPYDQAKLEAYVTATLNAKRLIAKWQPLVDQANSEEQAAALTEQANNEIEAMIEATPDITLVEYLEISEAAQKDPALMNRLTDIAEAIDGS